MYSVVNFDTTSLHTRGKKMKSTIKVQDILAKLHDMAPPGLAMSWDNVGLLLGDTDWTVDKVLLTLDVTPTAVDKAIQSNADVIVSHHPLIFHPIKSITNPLHLALAEHKIAVICAHTNLDLAPNGVNFALAEKLSLRDLTYISRETGADWHHVSVYVPEDNVQAVQNAVTAAGAGRIGNYDQCATWHPVTGTFRSLSGSRPFMGSEGEIETVQEIELEFFVDSFYSKAVIQAMISAHPYEIPAYYIVPVKNASPTYGLGLTGTVDKPVSLKQFAVFVKDRLRAPAVRLWLSGSLETDVIRRVAVCGGSGNALISQVFGKADVYVTGDIDYHNMLESKIPIIDAGHFFTEYPVLEKLKETLADCDVQLNVFSPQEHEINRCLFV